MFTEITLKQIQDKDPAVFPKFEKAILHLAQTLANKTNKANYWAMNTDYSEIIIKDFDLFCFSLDKQYPGRGLRFDLWQKNSKLGEGGFGGVYKVAVRFKVADDQQTLVTTSRPRVVKVAKFNKATEEGVLYACDNEYDIGKDQVALHVHQPGAFMLDQSTRSGVVVMEAREVAGKSFITLLDDGTTISALNIIKIAIKLTLELERLHQQGVMHGDIKPDNALIGLDGLRVTLIDFNLSSRGPKKKEDIFSGTDGFIAPEAFHWERNDFNSDIFSLGRTLGYMFGDLSINDLMEKPSFEFHVFTSTSFSFLQKIDSALLGSLANKLNQACAANSAYRLSLCDLKKFLIDFYERAKQDLSNKLIAKVKQFDQWGELLNIVRLSQAPEAFIQKVMRDINQFQQVDSPEEKAEFFSALLRCQAVNSDADFQMALMKLLGEDDFKTTQMLLPLKSVVFVEKFDEAFEQAEDESNIALCMRRSGSPVFAAAAAAPEEDMLLVRQSSQIAIAVH